MMEKPVEFRYNKINSLPFQVDQRIQKIHEFKRKIKLIPSALSLILMMYLQSVILFIFLIFYLDLSSSVGRLTRSFRKQVYRGVICLW